MSLATLARKTKAKQRVRTRGNFILNMTGRGNVLGMNAKMSRGNCGGKLTKCAGKRAACCVGVPVESPIVAGYYHTVRQGTGPTRFVYGYDCWWNKSLRFVSTSKLNPLNKLIRWRESFGFLSPRKWANWC